MSCGKCEARTDPDGSNAGVAFYRWKNANVMVVGCDEHLREIFDVLTAAQLKLASAKTTKP